MDNRESLTAQLIANPEAVKFYGQIPVGANIGALADKYVQLSAHTDKTSEAVCLAIEVHVRDTAAYHCHRAEYRDALAKLETAQEHARKRKAAARRSNAARRIKSKAKKGS